METGGAGHDGGLVMTRLRLSLSGGGDWLTDWSLLGKFRFVWLICRALRDAGA